MAYVRVDDTCDYCGENARSTGRGLKWADGGTVLPIKNATLGIKCADCRYHDFDDFCRSQGATAEHPFTVA